MNCKYHNQKKALWHCHNCDTPFCLDCCDIEPGIVVPRCLLCRNDLATYGISDKIEPFWNKLGQFNKYPFQDEAMKFLGVFTIIAFVLGIIISFLPLFLVKTLIKLTIVSIGVSYVFKVLTQVARGNFEAPTYDEAVSFNNDDMTKKVVGLYLALVALGIAAFQFLGGPGLITYTVLLGCVMPAMLIVLAMDKHIPSALNPIILYRTMTGIGWPYVLLVVFVYMIGLSLEITEGFLYFWLPEALSFSLTFAALAFFHIIMFSMLGYVVYQYHAELGYGIDIETLITNDNVQNVEELRLLAHADAYIHEGRFEDAEMVLYKAAKAPQYKAKALERLVKLNIARKNPVAAIKAAKAYFDNPRIAAVATQALELYLAIQKFEPRFRPMNANARAVLMGSMRSRQHKDIVDKLSADLIEKFEHNASLAKALLAQAKYYMEILNDDEQAMKMLNTLLELFPKGAHEREARQLLDICRNISVPKKDKKR